MPQEDALRHATPKFASGAVNDPDLSLIAEQETDLTKRWTTGPGGVSYVERLDGTGEYLHLESGTLDLGLVKVEPWRWWMRFVPGRPRAVNYLRSFPPGPTQDEDARAWWESLR